jgi:hypothetical protein
VDGVWPWRIRAPDETTHTIANIRSSVATMGIIEMGSGAGRPFQTLVRGIERDETRTANLGFPSFEGEFGDATFVEVAQPERDHAFILLPRGTGERKTETRLRAERPGDGGIFRRVRG